MPVLRVCHIQLNVSSGLAVAFNDELATSEELKEVVEVFLRKTKLKNVETDDGAERTCHVLAPRRSLRIAPA